MSSPRRPIMAGNWKMYKSTAEAKAFVTALAGILKDYKAEQLPEIVLCPAFTLLESTQKQAQEAGLKFNVAAQTMDSHAQGAYTGEVSAPMLLDLGIKWVVFCPTITSCASKINDTSKSVWIPCNHKCSCRNHIVFQHPSYCKCDFIGR